MQEESRVTGADEWITTGVTAHGEVASTMDTKLAVDIAGIGLHDGLELLNVVVVQNEAGGVQERSVTLGHAGVEIALEAALVAVGKGIRRGIDVGGPVLGEGDGADVDDHVGEGTGGDAAAAGAGREGDQRGGVEGLGENQA